MVDELIYSELAKSFAASGRFLVRGQANFGVGLVYPALISPAWRLFGADARRLRGREGDQLGADVAGGRARPTCSRGASSAVRSRCSPRCSRSRPVDGLHGHADDRERVLPALPRSCVWLLVARARAADAARCRSALLALCADRVPDARAGGRAACPRSRSRRRSSPGIAASSWRALARWRVTLRAARARRRRRRSSSRRCAAARCSAPTRSATRGDYTAAASFRWLLYHVGELSLYVGVVPLAAFAAARLARPRAAAARCRRSSPRRCP